MKISFLITCVCLMILLSCIDKIELKNHEFSTKALVIQGKLVKGTLNSHITATIQRLGEYGTNEREAYITSAKVSILDENNNSLELISAPRSTGYELIISATNPTLKIEIGKSYKLRVIMPDGKVYLSNPEAIYPVPKPDKIWNETAIQKFQDNKGVVQTRQIIRFRISTSVTPTMSLDKSKLKWESSIVYKITDDVLRVCYSNEPQQPEKINIVDPTRDNTTRLDSIIALETALDYRFAEASYINVLLESLSTEAYEYWNQVKLLAERSGNMFEPPAATIRTNFKNPNDESEKVFGYFYATVQDTLRLKIDSTTVGKIRTYCPQPPTDRIGLTICNNCLLIGSTASTTKPYYWK